METLAVSTEKAAGPNYTYSRELFCASFLWQDFTEPLEFTIWMASSEVDQKFLGHYATRTSHTNPFLSGMLYKILGLSVILSKKLLRARKLRRLDPTRETKSLQLYHHILWLSREGLIIIEQYVHHMVTDYVELKVLAYKLQASFYHIFVLFHNQPRIHHPGIETLPSSGSHIEIVNGTSTPRAKNGRKAPGSSTETITRRESLTSTPPLTIVGGPVGPVQPPGLGMPQLPHFAASFILPALDYTPRATECFTYVATLADQLLPGSHPVRLSVKLEYAAYLYDCLNDSTGCRRLAKQAIADVYNAKEGMDDESFEDAAELVSILGKMVKRGGKTASSLGGSSTAGAAADRSASDGSRTTPTRGIGVGEPGAGAKSASDMPQHRHLQQQTTPRLTPISHEKPLPVTPTKFPPATVPTMANPI
ncbi:hypothetical protein FQN57_006892 [Myotisia sp. PD_48]|nr:hypothetical protein FQN57_006892 [Myotisia sp. PD_48]